MRNRFLTLVRHAKSSWKMEGQLDYDRPLNERGNSDAALMANRMLERQCIPDLILCSSAKRALETSAYFMKAFGFDEQKLQVEKSLYLSSPEIMLEQLAIAEDGHKHIMIIAHNPGLEQLSYSLCSGCLPSMPTLGIRHFACKSLSALPLSRHTSPSSDPSEASVELLFEDFPKNTP